MIEFNDVAVCYDPSSRYPVNALERISLKLDAGDWAFVVGPSGVGKSTLLKLVYSGAQATRGKVVVDGQDITHLPQREIPLLRRKIGVIFQDFQLLPQKTVWENVAFALQVIGSPQKRLVRDVPRALETVGLTYKSNARPHELSGGEQQRVAIARAIVNNPRILIADEPTGNLDPQTAWDIAQLLERINDQGTTILMATHDRALVDGMRQRVIRIANGLVVSDEAEGVYHPEDDEPRFRRSAPSNEPQSDPAMPAPSPTVSGAAGEPAFRRRWDNLRAPVPTGNGATTTHTEPEVEATEDVAAPEHEIPPVPSGAGNGKLVVPGLPTRSGLRPNSYQERAESGAAPIGSPDNPIVQFGPVPK